MKQIDPQKAFFSFDHLDDSKPPWISQAASVFFNPITNSSIQIEGKNKILKSS